MCEQVIHRLVSFFDLISVKKEIYVLWINPLGSAKGVAWIGEDDKPYAICDCDSLRITEGAFLMPGFEYRGSSSYSLNATFIQ
jgi:hypothetical protein